MRHSRTLLLGSLLLLLGCSKSDQPKTETTSTKTTPAEAPLNLDNAPFAAAITSKGYRVVQARRFPAQLAGRRATVVVYQAGDGKSGGVLYTQRMGEGPDRLSWHWLFKDSAPDSIQPAEINNDGLWDARLYMKGGKVVELVQGQGFTFMGPERESLVAMNGESSAPADLWKCFDGDTATVWQSSAQGAYLDLPNPFGVGAAELTLRLPETDRPQRVELVAGESKQSLDLAATTAEQRFALDAAITAASSIRVQVEGSGTSVAISELGIR